MTANKRLGSIVVLGALILGACASGEGVQGTTATSRAVDVDETEPAVGTTQPEGNADAGVPAIVDNLEPAGSVTGGNVSESYVDGAFPPELSSLIDLAIGHLAKANSVDESAITVVLVEEVVWSDASLGCPQPGMSYAQVVTDGMRIILGVDGALYDYRSGGFSDPVPCSKVANKSETRTGKFHVTDEGEIVIVPGNKTADTIPTENIDPPNE